MVSAFAAGLLLALPVVGQAGVPVAVADDLTFALWAKDLKEPTSMAWVALAAKDGAKPADVLLVLEKYRGNVRGIVHEADGAGRMLKNPAIKLAVNFKGERGLLGIAVHPKFAENRFVYLFYTQSNREGADGRSDVTRGQTVMRFTLSLSRGAGGEIDSIKLDAPKEILTFPYQPDDSNGPNYCGGKILFGLDGKLYGVFGNQNRHGVETNEPGGRVAAGIVFRVNDDGTVPADNPWAGHKDPWVQKYFAVGILNSFGLAFDPLTKSLWMTENGDTAWDELNLVPPKFNSGSNYIAGPLADAGNRHRKRVEVPADRVLGSVYGDPVFAWERCRGLTCLAFLNTDRYGEKHKGTLLVAEVNGGQMMQFRLNKERDRVAVTSAALDGRVVRGESPEEIAANQKEILFATGAATITDMQLGRDGLLYCLSYHGGVIYVVKPKK
jgi:glucose/arabinose dehydrogenase